MGISLQIVAGSLFTLAAACQHIYSACPVGPSIVLRFGHIKVLCMFLCG